MGELALSFPKQDVEARFSSERARFRWAGRRRRVPEPSTRRGAESRRAFSLLKTSARKLRREEPLARHGVFIGSGRQVVWSLVSSPRPSIRAPPSQAASSAGLCMSMLLTDFVLFLAYWPMRS